MPPNRHKLPETTNTLTPQQRTHLVRSSRKIEAVLGTTPYVLDDGAYTAAPPPSQRTPRSLKRQGTVFTDYQYPSSLSVGSTGASSNHPCLYAPAPPYGSSPNLPYPGPYQTVPPSPTRDLMTRPGEILVAPPQPCLRLDTGAANRYASCYPPADPYPPTPVTPTMPDEAELRRRRSAKLTRHLGEPIPSELLLTPNPPLTKPDEHRLLMEKLRSAGFL